MQEPKHIKVFENRKKEQSLFIEALYLSFVEINNYYVGFSKLIEYSSINLNKLLEEYKVLKISKKHISENEILLINNIFNSGKEILLKPELIRIKEYFKSFHYEHQIGIIKHELKLKLNELSEFSENNCLYYSEYVDNLTIDDVANLLVMHEEYSKFTILKQTDGCLLNIKLNKDEIDELLEESLNLVNEIQEKWLDFIVELIKKDILNKYIKCDYYHFLFYNSFIGIIKSKYGDRYLGRLIDNKYYIRKRCFFDYFLEAFNVRVG